MKEKKVEPDILLFCFLCLTVAGVKKMASQQQQPGGPMSQPGLQQPTSLQQQQQQLSQQQDFDPVHRFKMLIPQLKESLQVPVQITKTSGHDSFKLLSASTHGEML